jgi:hypothetical protein
MDKMSKLSHGGSGSSATRFCLWVAFISISIICGFATLGNVIHGI